MSGIKFDGDKLRYDLIPVIPMALVAEVYTIGAKKYADRNWEAGIDFDRILGAIERHFQQYKAGEKVDREDGQHHLASVVWGALCLMEFERTRPEFDKRNDRNKPLTKMTIFEAMEETKKNDGKK